MMNKKRRRYSDHHQWESKEHPDLHGSNSTRIRYHWSHCNNTLHAFESARIVEIRTSMRDIICNGHRMLVFALY